MTIDKILFDLLFWLFNPADYQKSGCEKKLFRVRCKYSVPY